jgi:hypothetical protein
MRASACFFHQAIKKHFSSATFNGKPWRTLYDDKGVQNYLLMFGPETLNVVPALLTYAASKTKGIIIPEIEQAYEELIADIASTGHTIAAEGIKAWVEAEARKLRAEAVFVEATVFPAVPSKAAVAEQVVARLSDEECTRLLASIREKMLVNE